MLVKELVGSAISRTVSLMSQGLIERHHTVGQAQKERVVFVLITSAGTGTEGAVEA